MTLADAPLWDLSSTDAHAGAFALAENLILSDDEFDTIRMQLKASWQRTYPGEPLPEPLDFNDVTWSPFAFAEAGHTGVLVALWIDPETAEQLATKAGEPAAALHITLCHGADAAQYDDLTLARILTSIDDVVRWRDPIEGVVSGHGRFYATDSSDAKDVVYAVPSVPGLAELRNDVASALRAAGVSLSDQHGWTPHITLAYLDETAKLPALPKTATPLRFAAVTVCIGDRKTTIPFRPAEPLAFASIATSADNVERVYSAVEFAEPPEWSPFLPKSGQYAHPVHGALDFGPSTYQRIVDNFKSGAYQDRLPVNAEHDPKASGAVGWITDLRLNADTSIDARVDWNDRGRALIEGDRFKYVSAEILPQWTDPVSQAVYERVPIGMAICTRPYFKESVLRPLAASDAVWTYRPEGQGELGMTKPEEAASGATSKVVQLTETELIELREAKKTADSLAVKLAGAETELADIKKRQRVQAFTAEVRGKSDENDRAWPGEAEKHVSMLVSLAETFGEESDQFRQYVTVNRSAAEQVKTLSEPIGSGREGSAATALDKLNAKAIELAEKSGITREQAFVQVMDSDKELAQAYLRERR